MKVLSLIALIGVATAAECTDANVVAKTKIRDADKLAVETNTKEAAAEADADKKKVITDKAEGLKSALEASERGVLIAVNSCVPGDATVEPVDAQSQLKKVNNAKAVTDLKEWDSLIASEKKADGGYDKLSVEAKKEWDDKTAAVAKKTEARDLTEKTDNGFAKMTEEQQTVYMGGLLVWKKDKYKICKADPKSDKCLHADALRAKQEKKKNTDKYYGKTQEDRTKDDASASAAAEADLKDITAAAVKPVIKKPEVVVKKGLVAGSECKKGVDGTRPACQEGSCCGLLKKGFMGGSKEQCHPKEKTSVTIKVGDVDEAWNMSCITGAKKFTAGVASVLIASYMMA